MATSPRPPRKPAPKPLKAKWSTLAEFRKLRDCEKVLLEACRDGEVAIFNNGKRPEDPPDDEQDRLRPDFVRFLCLGGDDEAPVHEKGVQIIGGWIEGDLDLDCCIAPNRILVINSVIDGDVRIQDASIEGLYLNGSTIKALYGDSAVIAGSLHLKNGFHAKGEVRLLGAEIGGDLDCSGGRFKNQGKIALICDRVKIKGSVYLRNKFHAKGEVRLLGAEIAGVLDCSGGRFENEADKNENKIALFCDRAKIKGSVYLGNDFHATGEVRLLGAEIGGVLNCSGGRFENEGDDALCCDGAAVTGGFFFREVEAFRGSASLANMSVGVLLDDSASWAKGKGHILDGFRYGSIANGPTDAASRIAWLDNQREDLLTTDFCPQPWQQLIRTLRRMGHATEADDVAIAFQDRRRRAGRVRGFSALLHWLFGQIAGYGYKPMRLIGWMLFVWFLCTGVFQAAMVHGIMAPANPHVFNHKGYQSCRPVIGNRNDKTDLKEFVDWASCPKGPLEYTTFSPPLYSLDLILPLVELQQDKDWAPMVQKPAAVKDDNGKLVHDENGKLEISAKWWPAGVAVRMVMWFEILFGWVASLLLVAVLTGLTNREGKDAA